MEGEVQKVGRDGNTQSVILGLNIDTSQGLLHRRSVNNNIQPKHNGGNEPMAVQRLHHNPASSTGASQSAKQRVHHHIQEGEEDGQHEVQQRPPGGHHHRDHEVIIVVQQRLIIIDMFHLLRQPVTNVVWCWRMWDMSKENTLITDAMDKEAFHFSA